MPKFAAAWRRRPFDDIICQGGSTDESPRNPGQRRTWMDETNGMEWMKLAAVGFALPILG